MRAFKGFWNFAASKGRRFRRNQRGVSTVEYALIVVAVIAIIGVAAAALSGAFNELFNDLSAQLGNAVAETENAAQ